MPDQPPKPKSIPTPGKLLHNAIAKNDWPAAERILLRHGAAAGSAKNATGSTPLMLAANGKCGKRHNSLLLEALLKDGNGGARSAAERDRRGRTAADIALARGAASLSLRLRSLERAAEAKERFARCPRCMAKLRSRSRLAFVRDRVRRGEEENALVLELFEEHPLAVERLDVRELHRVNCCVGFRKELTESMSLVSELKRIRGRSEGTSSAAAATATMMCPPRAGPSARQLFEPSAVSKPDDDDWRGWHVVDLCSGAQCFTAALCLSILPGISVTALDIVSSDQIPHFEDVEWTAVRRADGENGIGSDICRTTNGTTGAGDARSSFSYMQQNIHDSNLSQRLRSHISTNGAAYAGEKVVVLAMHCCGALSRRALTLFEELDAAAVLVMPCCLPPKAPRAATTWNPSLVSTDCDGKAIEDAAYYAKAMAEVFATSNQEEQYRRWAGYLRQCAANGNASADSASNGVVTELREVDAVLSARNTLITAIRSGGALAGAARTL